jgi:RHS repeat-associated protein
MRSMCEWAYSLITWLLLAMALPAQAAFTPQLATNGQALPQAQRTYYLYADEGLIAESTQAITLNADGSVTASAAPQISTQYGPRPDSEFTTGTLFVKTKNSNNQDSFAYFHHDQLQTPLQATDKMGNVVWAASYNAFGKASITTPAASAANPTINVNLRLPGQYLDEETGLHYNYRRYYDADSGRYVTQDPIGVEGGINQYKYAAADPVNLSDPTGECPMCVAYAACVAQCMLEDVAVNTVTGQCNNFGDSAKGCAASCLMGPLGRLAKWAGKSRVAKEAASCAFSFPAETLVHVKPKNANEQNAQLSKADLKPINALQVGDEVLAHSERVDKGDQLLGDQRLSYEKITDVFTSNKLQTFVHITLNNGETVTATENHPFKTIEGWRDAIMLKKGGKLLLKGGDGEDLDKTALITDIRNEQKMLPVFNIEVANAHTFFVGTDGKLAHNGVVYCRTAPGTNRKPYFGKSDDDKNFGRRKRSHDDQYGTEHNYEVVYRGPETCKALEAIEQAHIDANNGPTNKGNPNGGTENRRNNTRKR